MTSETSTPPSTRARTSEAVGIFTGFDCDHLRRDLGHAHALERTEDAEGIGDRTDPHPQARRRQQIAHVHIGAKLSAAQDDELRAGAFRFVERLRGHEHRAAFSGQRRNQFAQLQRARGIESCGWLVEKQHRGIRQQCRREREPLLHARRIARHRTACGFCKPCELQKLRASSVGDRRQRHAGESPQVLFARHVRVEMRRLGQQADAGADGARIPGHVTTENAYNAG